MARRLTLVFTLLALSTMSLLATTTGPASAGPPNTWTKLGDSPQVSAQAGLERGADGRLHVVWVQKNASTTNHFDLVSTPISPTGSVGTKTTLVSNEDNIDLYPDLTKNCNLLAPYSGTLGGISGIRTVQSDPASSPEGSAWLSPQTKSTDAGTVGATALGGCRPFIAYTGSQGLEVITDQGTRSSTNFQDPCCYYVPNLSASLPVNPADPQRLWLGWYSGTSDPATSGLFVQEVNTSTGNPIGSKTRVPGSATLYNGVLSGVFEPVRIPMAAQPNTGDVYVLYTSGYPITTKLILWRVGDPNSTVVVTRKNGLSDPALAADANGSLWVLWTQQGSSQLFSRYSTPDLSYWTPASGIPFPKPPNTPSVQAWTLSLDTQQSVLDVVGNFTSGTGSAFYAGQIATPVVGTAGKDTLTGTKYPEVLVGRDGNDTIKALDGNDIVYGDAGDDVLRGGRGKDKLYGGAGKHDKCFVTKGDKTVGCETVKNE